MLPTNVRYYATLHLVEAPGALRANLWCRPQDPARDRSAGAMTLFADHNASTIPAAIADAINRGVSACVKFQNPWAAMDVLAEYLEARVGAPGAAQ